ncbi:adenine deaminase C-terminal domain-containing protein [Rhizobium hidalgonense]|uniref:Adenine deaminase n=1 Tax=Rhizobium hidalgonense TaxID=1538159 RepID=A0AAJ2GZA6_9HYPH|nr:adenine deaminase C-terminal domain-containing protein [Rhizobium hidalgonense]MDR9775153.1 adenine deaminase C-terminal domain-containing protein [Rhizobium hidalgonense]MDR9811867.1 adenine deaminase C-terminal domain-containing protein [Rhizobium hidalgonense]MDR9819895.1 adenine deaminase C-terminal domain-containing protein [Rhizobium hidalgonense]
MNAIPSREPADLNDPALRARAVAAARGDAPFDVLITGGRLLDVVTGLVRKVDIGLVGALISSVHAPESRTDAVEIIDAAGGILTPGLIDTHMHVESSMVTPAEYASAVLPRGVTTVVWDPHEFGNVHGLDGVRWAIEAARSLPLRMILLAPSCVPSAPGLERAGADFDAAVIAEMLRSSAVGGVAEVMNMRGVIDGDPRMTAIVNAGLASGKLVCGHARGLEGADLNAFMAAGVTSDHELTSGTDLAAKLSAGLTIELRGSHDHLLKEFVEVLNGIGHLPPTVTLCTDDVFPDELYQSGGLDDVIRRLVRYGLKPEWALRAATFNATQRLKRSDLGLLAAGRRADIVLFEDLTEFRARLVISGGRIAARNGSMQVGVRKLDPAPLENSVKLPQFGENDFRIPSRGERVRVATIDRPRFTQWGEVETEVKDGFVVPPAGSAMIAVAHRHGKADATQRIGFLTGWGEWRGAFCTTVSHDSHNLTVFGGNACDMALAANVVISAGGGMAVAKDGKIEAILPLPLSGLVTDASLKDTASAFAGIRKAMEKIVDWKPPYRVFKACFGATLACNAGPHQTDRGIADVVTGKVLESPVLEVL